MARPQLTGGIAAAALLVAALAAGGSGAGAAGGDPARGRALATALCSRCHAVEVVGRSPMPAAPPFRTLPERYPIESLAEALAEGLLTGHPGMPEIQLEPGAIADFLAFLDDLAQRAR